MSAICICVRGDSRSVGGPIVVGELVNPPGDPLVQPDVHDFEQPRAEVVHPVGQHHPERAFDQRPPLADAPETLP